MKNLYNGNISETFWRTNKDNVLRSYGYTYDDLNRLRNAQYIRPVNPLLPNTNLNPIVNTFNESMQYDKNGNIVALQRNGGMESQSPAVLIDDLIYQYDGNQLLNVEDTVSNAINGFNDGAHFAVEYTYDLNGNMTTDKNKGIVNGTNPAITYNHLNLPTKIIMAGGTITYVYNALGQKVSKTVSNSTISPATTSNTQYFGGFQYNNSILQFFPTAEGYVKNTVVSGANTYDYIFNYTDHLGNIRLSYGIAPGTQLLTIFEENNYYPFGLKHGNYNNQLKSIVNLKDVAFLDTPLDVKAAKAIPIGPDTPKGDISIVANSGYQYKYQGQERQDELGLNWDSFKWRNYDYAIGRFMSIDPLAEKYPYNGTYNFSENRVIDGVELEGLEVVLLVDKGNYVKGDVGHTFVVLGSGKDMTAYTYGRWAGTNENSSGSHSPLNNGSGVMVKLEGKEAMQEAQKYVDKYGAQGYEIENASESFVRTKLEDEFNSSSQTPDTGKYKGDERAHVIDNYDLTSNNCTTKSLDAVHKGLGKPIEVTTTTTAGGFPVVQKDSTESTYAPKDLNNQLNQATKDPNSGVINVTDRFKTN